MSDNLISKKELLDLTGISYGQLYRWKRKNLIPEDWFIRKSSYTGQETFFPRLKIIPRIDKILNMKEDLSLDELADVFSPSLGEVQLSAGEILDRNIVTSGALNLYIQVTGHQDHFAFDKVLMIYVLDKLLQSGDISLDEGKMLLGTLEEHLSIFSGKDSQLILIRKMGVAAFILVSSGSTICFDQGVKIVTTLFMAQCTEELKLEIGGSEG